MKKILFHSIGYTLVAGIFFLGGCPYSRLPCDQGTQGGTCALRKVPEQAGATTRVCYGQFDAMEPPGPEREGRGFGPVGDMVRPMRCFNAYVQKPLRAFRSPPEFALIGVSLDNDASTVQQYCAAHDIPWEQLIEPRKKFDNSIARALEVDGVPFTCVIDQKGIVRFYDHSAHVEGVVARLLEEPNQTPTAVTPAAEQPARQP